ncbi:putative Calcium sensing receptor, chloroplastic [Nannochloris sp. 'desiccata']|nr:putative Calcium sensing receptor, chloroplastic [Chlorella desiccata (nom. nud.)]
MTSALRVRQLANSIGKNALVKNTGHIQRGVRRSSSAVVVASLPKHVKGSVAAAGVVLSSNAGVAHAEDGAMIDSAVSSIVEIVKSTGDAVKAGLGVAEQGLDTAKSAYQTISPAIQTATDAVTPAFKSAVQAATPVIKSGVRAAGEAASSVKPGLERVLSETVGVDGKAVAGAGEQAIASTKPLLESLVHFFTTSSPTVLAETAVGLVAAYYLLPPVLKASVGALRGYAGDVSPAAALDALSTQGKANLVDIRTAREKEQQGLPDVPNSGKLVELEFATIEDRKVRGQLRDIGKLEIKITAMQIAALKRLNKGAPLYLMDKNGGVAKAVARELGSRGFNKVFVVNNGFSGWLRDRLGSKLATSVSRVEVLLPGSVGRGSSTRQLNSGSTTRTVQALPPPRRALPSSTGR